MSEALSLCSNASRASGASGKGKLPSFASSSSTCVLISCSFASSIGASRCAIENGKGSNIRLFVASDSASHARVDSSCSNASPIGSAGPNSRKASIAKSDRLSNERGSK